MGDIYRIKALWSGIPGSPGVSTHYMNAAPGAADLTAIKNFWNTGGSNFPSGLTIQVQGVGDIVDDGTGDLIGAWSTTQPAAVVGASAAAYAAPVGVAVHWRTGTVMDGRRVTGTSFAVPQIAVYESNGTIQAAITANWVAAAVAMIAALSGKLVVWHRPQFGPKPGPGVPRPVIRMGASAVVTSASSPDLAVVLRSRRD